MIPFDGLGYGETLSALIGGLRIRSLFLNKAFLGNGFGYL